MISRVRGTFNSFNATIEAEEGFKKPVISAEIDVNSIDTRNEDRDNHLRSADFFDVEVFPTIRFHATPESLTSGNITGTFDLHGVTKEIPLKIEFYGEGKDPWGNHKVGFGFETENVLVGENFKL